MPNEELAIIEESQSLPTLPTKAELTDVVQRASDMASILKDVIDKNGLAMQIRGGQHIQVEAWQTVGRFCGYVGRTHLATEYTGDGVMGTAEIVEQSTGHIVSTASAICGAKGDGHWVNSPYNHQASMAQTRALGKAFRNVLSWIVVLAGYQPTPAEEMPPDAPAQAPRTPAQAPQGNDEYPCMVHVGRFWFQRGKMKSPAHPMDEGQPWCNPDDVLLELRISIGTTLTEKGALPEWWDEAVTSWGELSIARRLNAIQLMQALVTPTQDDAIFPEQEGDVGEILI